VQESAWPSIKKFPATKLLATDLIDTGGDVSHRVGNARPTWNALFIDGHVVSSVSPFLLQQMQKPPPAGDGPATDNWAAFEDYRDILEAQANGFDVAKNHPTGRVVHPSPDTVAGGQTLYHP